MTVPSWILAAAPALIGFSVSYLLVPPLCTLAHRRGIVSIPGGRRGHDHPTPLLGGASLFVPFLLVCTLFVGGRVSGFIEVSDPDLAKMVSLVIGTAWLFILGTADDVVRFGWKAKLVGQVMGCTVLVVGGHSIHTATLPWLGVVEFGWYGVPCFILAIIVITNAVNLIDGLDGLAGGICFFAALTSSVIAFAKGDLFTGVVGSTVAGSLLAFLRFNYPPASIFLGDGGSMMVGFLLGALATSSAAISPGQRWGTSVMLIVPFLPLGIPLFEVVLSVARRWISGQPIFSGDANHLHHRLVGRVRDPRAAVRVFYAFSAALCALTLLLVLGDGSLLSSAIRCVLALSLCGGMFAALRLYGFDHFMFSVRRRKNYKFLSAYLTYMEHRIQRADSLFGLLRLLESGVTDLGFRRVVVTMGGPVLFAWEPADAGAGETKKKPIHVAEQLPCGAISVEWYYDAHDDESFDQYAQLTWYRFLVALGNAAEQFYLTDELDPLTASASAPGQPSFGEIHTAGDEADRQPSANYERGHVPYEFGS
jgi:UDP-GlcNAc:undecaprenyl-phosphate/decaprenyl-phosphate GlcNAc-1-phosphate transferase